MNLAGEPTKGGVAPAEIDEFLALDVRGLSTMPPAASTPRRRAPWFARLRELAVEHGLSELSMGTSQDSAVAAEEGATYVRVGSILFRGVGSSSAMGFADLWNRTLVYFGIAEEETTGTTRTATPPRKSLEQSYRERPNVRRLTPRRRGQDFDDWTESEADGPTSGAAVRGASRARRGVRAPRSRPCRTRTASRVHLVLPRSFNDAQQIADKYKQGIPVILNLQSADTELSKRFIDSRAG